MVLYRQSNLWPWRNLAGVPLLSAAELKYSLTQAMRNSSWFKHCSCPSTQHLTTQYLLSMHPSDDITSHLRWTWLYVDNCHTHITTTEHWMWHVCTKSLHTQPLGYINGDHNSDNMTQIMGLYLSGSMFCTFEGKVDVYLEVWLRVADICFTKSWHRRVQDGWAAWFGGRGALTHCPSCDGNQNCPPPCQQFVMEAKLPLGLYRISQINL